MLDLVNFRPSVSQMVRFFVYPVMPPKFVLVSEDTAAWGARARPHLAKLRRTHTPSAEANFMSRYAYIHFMRRHSASFCCF